MKIKSTPGLRIFASVVLVFYGLYALTTMGMTGVLFSAAVGFFLYGYTGNFETAAMGSVLAGIVLYIITKVFFKKSIDGFTDSTEVIAKRIAEIKKPMIGVSSEPEGILSSRFAEAFSDYRRVEGFTDGSNDESKDEKKEAVEGKKDDKAVAAESKPAAATAAETFENKTAETPAGLDFLFKPGETPAEKKGGYHIDAGTTILNALNGLKPAQIEAMTSDTQKLMETQKSLLGMLNTMKPMLADVKPLMETFGQMFTK
jgi:hypothetical protein